MPLGLRLLTPKGLSTELGGKRATCSRWLCQAPVWRLGQVAPSPWIPASSSVKQG